MQVIPFIHPLNVLLEEKKWRAREQEWALKIHSFCMKRERERESLLLYIYILSLYIYSHSHIDPSSYLFRSDQRAEQNYKTFLDEKEEDRLGWFFNQEFSLRRQLATLEFIIRIFSLLLLGSIGLMWRGNQLVSTPDSRFLPFAPPFR